MNKADAELANAFEKMVDAINDSIAISSATRHQSLRALMIWKEMALCCALSGQRARRARRQWR